MPFCDLSGSLSKLFAPLCYPSLFRLLLPNLVLYSFIRSTSSPLSGLGILKEPTGTTIMHNGENHRISASYHPILAFPFHADTAALNCQSLHGTGRTSCICTYSTTHLTVQYCIAPRATAQLLHTSPRSSSTLILYSVFVFCSSSIEVATLLSGSNAATSLIFLNCHGNRDGYRNGRMSKPEKIKIQFQTRRQQWKAPKQ